MKYLELAKEILENNYAVVGVRSLQEDEHYEVGDYCRESYEWDREHDCSTYELYGEEGEKAGGTCATYIETNYFETDDWELELAKRIEEAIEYNKSYGGEQVIIAGDGACTVGSFDPNEVRIVNAIVIMRVPRD